MTSPDVAADVELAESLSIAMLTVLETLAPAERAVFVLREVFETPYDEIAEAVGKSPAAVRQIAHRARDHVAARRPRMPVSTAEQQKRRWTASSPPSETATCKASSTSSRPMSSSSPTEAAWSPLLVVRSRGAERVAGYLIAAGALGGLRGEGRLAQRVTRRPDRHRRRGRTPR